LRGRNNAFWKRIQQLLEFFCSYPITLFILKSVLCCFDSQWACSISLYLRITICCPYFLAFGFHQHQILLFIFLSKRFGRRKERTQLYPCIDSDLRENRQIFYMSKQDSVQPCSFISLLSKRDNRIKTIKKRKKEKKRKHHYHSTTV